MAHRELHNTPERVKREAMISCCGFGGPQLEACGDEPCGEISSLRELDTRTSEALTVSLYWDAVRDVPLIKLHDHRRSIVWTFDVPRAHAMDAFDHPFIFKPDDRA